MSGWAGTPPGPFAEAPGPPFSVGIIAGPPGAVTGPLEGSCFVEGSVDTGFCKPGPSFASDVVSKGVSSSGWLSVGSCDEVSSALSLLLVSFGSDAGSLDGVSSFMAVVSTGAGMGVVTGS